MRVDPGVAVPEESVFVRERLGVPPRGVVTAPQLFAVGSPGVDVALQAVLVTDVAEAGRVASIRSAKVAVCAAPGARDPTGREQVAPGLIDGEQDQPAELAAASKRV